MRSIIRFPFIDTSDLKLEFPETDKFPLRELSYKTDKFFFKIELPLIVTLCRNSVVPVVNPPRIIDFVALPTVIFCTDASNILNVLLVD